jgi:hemoglobin
MERPFELLGPDDAARLARLDALVTDFYDRVFGDVMIGFLFWGKDKAKLIRLETQFSARLLGADVPYEGRPMPAAHRASPILGGHFERRQQILREVLAAHDVPEAVRDAWLSHNDRLRAQVTGDSGTECDHDRAAAGPAGEEA